MQKEALFFIITAINILVAGVFVVMAIYTISILRDVKDLSKKAKKEGKEILDDVKTLRENVKQEGENLKNTGRFFAALFKKRK